VLKIFWIILFIFTIIILHDTRLLIFSPHPDDESLRAAGLIQRVLKEGGKVKVVFMTNGDGFPEGWRGRIASPIPPPKITADTGMSAWRRP